MATQPEPPADDDFARVALDPLDSRRASYSPRRLLNRVSALVALLLVLATLPAWLPLGGRALALLFPPPPYRGTSLYIGTQYGSLLALRSSDGLLRWRSTPNRYDGQNYDGEVEVAGGSALTVERDVQGLQASERVVALSASTGRVRWSSQATEQSMQVLGSQGGAVYAVEAPHEITLAPGPPTLLAFDVISGRLRWQYQPPAPPVFGLALEPATIYLSAAAGPSAPVTLTALDLTSGRPRWQVEQAGQIIAGSAALVYVETNVALVALDAATGALRWQVPLDGGAAAVVGDLAVVGGTVEQATPRGVLRAYDATTGAARWQRAGVYLLWQADTDVTGLEASDPLLVATDTGYAGLDVATGAVRWQGSLPVATASPAPGRPQGIPAPPDPIIGGGRYYWFDGSAAVAVSSASGKVLWLRMVPYQPIGSSSLPRVSSAYYAGGTLYCVADDQIFALDDASGRLRWRQDSGAGGVTTVQVAP